MVRRWATIVGLVLVAPALAQAQAQGVRPQAATDDAVVDALVLRSWRACEQRRCEDALDDIERAGRMAPERADVQLLLGEALYWHHRYREALGHYERALQLVPTIEQAYRGIGFTCFELSIPEWNHPRTRLRLLERAFWAFQIARLLEPGDPAAVEGARKVAVALNPDGHTLRPLEYLIGALLLLLFVAVAFRLRALRWSGARALLRSYRSALLLFVASRALVLGSFALAPALIAEGPPHPPQLIRHHVFVLDAVASRWDSNFYLDVAARGYRIEPTGGPGRWSTVGQFPLLPVLFYWAAHALDDRHLAALILPHAALLLACLFLYDHFRARCGERTALLALAVLLLHPGSLYGSVLYTEPFALLGVAGAVWAIERGARWEGALWGVFAGLARFSSIALLPWLLLLGLRDLRDRPLRATRVQPVVLARAALPALAPLLGVALFMTYLQLELGDALAYFHELRRARFASQGLFVGAGEIARELACFAGFGKGVLGPHLWFAFAIAMVALYVWLARALLRERDLGPGLYVACGVVLSLTSSLAAQPRYLWLLFPAAPLIARVLDRPRPRFLLIAAASIVLAIASIAYSRWYYVT